MPVILGKSGENKELKEVYLGLGGVNKQEKELYLGKSGVNKKVFQKSLFEMVSIPSNKDYTQFPNSPFTPKSSIKVKINPNNSQGSAEIRLYPDNYYNSNWFTRFMAGYDTYYSSYSYMITYNGYQVMYNTTARSDSNLFEIIFNSSNIQFYINSTLISTKPYIEFNLTSSPVPIYGYNSIGSNSYTTITDFIVN